ncbi:MAG: hypothetical protein NRZ52_30400 (plasmid) [Bacillus paranthracis]|nr:MAG: hypothetical protein NRZ52_30400 [Bacillus paranthracis]
MDHIEIYNKTMSDLYMSLNKYFGLKPMEFNGFSVNDIKELIKHQDTITHCSLLTTDSVDADEYAEEYTLLVRFKPNKKKRINPDIYKDSDSDASEVYVKTDKFGCPLQTSKPEKKFALEFDEPPALVFISHDGKKDDLYINGKGVQNWTAVKIDSAIDKYTEYDLSLLALKPKDESK